MSSSVLYECITLPHIYLREHTYTNTINKQIKHNSNNTKQNRAGEHILVVCGRIWGQSETKGVKRKTTNYFSW